VDMLVQAYGEEPLSDGVEQEGLRVQPGWRCLMQANDNGALPIHTACANSPSVEVAQKMLSLYPESCNSTDDDEQTILHAACCNDSPAAVGIVETALQMCRSCCGPAAQEDNLGRLPLHLAAAFSSSPGVIHRLAAEYPLGLMKGDMDGCYPLHAACCNQTARAGDVVHALLSHAPAATKHSNIQLELPAMFYATVTHAEKSVMRHIIQAWPEAIWRIPLGPTGEERGCANVRPVLEEARGAVESLYLHTELGLHQVYQWSQRATRNVMVQLLMAQRRPETSGQRLAGLPKEIVVRIAVWVARQSIIEPAERETPYHPKTGQPTRTLPRRAVLKSHRLGLPIPVGSPRQLRVSETVQYMMRIVQSADSTDVAISDVFSEGMW